MECCELGAGRAPREAMTALGPSPTAVAVAVRPAPGCCARGSVLWAGRRGTRPAPTPLPAALAAAAPPRPAEGGGTEYAALLSYRTPVLQLQLESLEPGLQSWGTYSCLVAASVSWELGGRGGGCSKGVANCRCPFGGTSLPPPSLAGSRRSALGGLLRKKQPDAFFPRVLKVYALHFPKGSATSAHSSYTLISRTLRVARWGRK